MSSSPLLNVKQRTLMYWTGTMWVDSLPESNREGCRSPQQHWKVRGEKLEVPFVGQERVDAIDRVARFERFLANNPGCRPSKRRMIVAELRRLNSRL